MNTVIKSVLILSSSFSGVCAAENAFLSRPTFTYADIGPIIEAAAKEAAHAMVGEFAYYGGAALITTAGVITGVGVGTREKLEFSKRNVCLGFSAAACVAVGLTMGLCPQLYGKE